MTDISEFENLKENVSARMQGCQLFHKTCNSLGMIHIHKTKSILVGDKIDTLYPIQWEFVSSLFRESKFDSSRRF